MAENRHRISLRDVDPAKYSGDWADIVEHRSWGDSLAIQVASAQGIREYQNERVTRLVKAWSLDGHPSNVPDVENASEHVIRFLIEEMEAFYGAQREEIENRRKASGTS
jgi:hypothetical protein